MNVLIVTCGTSAISNNHIGRAPQNRDNRQLMGTVSRYLASSKDRQSIQDWPDLFDDLTKAHRLFWDQERVYREQRIHRRETSAELLSTYFLAQKPERTYLLVSDTQEGWFAASINARIMEETWGWKVHKVQGDGLDTNFKDVFNKVETVFRNKINVPEHVAVTLNITGGFKGVIPSLTLLAHQRSWEIVYMHEESSQIVALDAVTKTVRELRPAYPEVDLGY